MLCPVRSIKSFIAAFPGSDAAPSDTSEAQLDAAKVQSFLEATEQAFRGHALWAGADARALEAAGEGLEKDLMTKLHARAFALCPEEAAEDARADVRRRLLAAFVRPEHLDVPQRFCNERSWTLAMAELQKINTFKAPRDKLVCILNCCKVVTNLLNVSAAESDGAPPGADDFLPVLIYVVLRAGVPGLYANLLYIERYRKESRLVSEAQYYFTNLQSAHAFIERADAGSLSIEEVEFAASMRAAAEEQGVTLDEQLGPVMPPPEPAAQHAVQGHTASPLSAAHAGAANTAAYAPPVAATPPPAPPPPVPSIIQLTVEELEMIGREEVAQAASVGELARHRFLFTPPHRLKVGDVVPLLTEYKELVLRYEALARGVTCVMAGAATETPAVLGAAAMAAAAAPPPPRSRRTSRR